MLLPISWLKDYVSTKETPKQIAERFTLSGSEVESILTADPHLEHVVVGEILEIYPHPNADRLRITTVSTGDDTTHTIVCGAPNIKVGQKVPVALPGTTLPGDFTIMKTKIRGEESEGMICSEHELGLGADHEGIMVLQSKSVVGAPLTDSISGEPVIDLDITPNRGDLFSLEGLAREYSALIGKKIKAFKKTKVLPKTVKRNAIRLSIEKNVDTPYYSALLVEGITVAPSPEFIQERLRLLGLKPINNVVDITNYVMYVTGQPLHAFDADTLGTGDSFSIGVRRAKKGEQFLTLDDTLHTLTSENLVITDGKKPIALAGVMGGSESGVTDTTTRIVLETARFHPSVVRKSARSLHIFSDSSQRFERGVDPENSYRATGMALELIEKYAQGKVMVFVEKDTKEQARTNTISVTYEHIDSLVGISIPQKKIYDYLTVLGFSIKKESEGIVVTVPSWRHDIELAEDIIDEIIRLYGINNLPSTFVHGALTSPQGDGLRALQQTFRHALVSYGFHEQLSYSYYGDALRKGDALSHFCDGRYDHLVIEKPLTPDHAFLRKSILPYLLTYLSHNINREQDVVSIKQFEIGKVYMPHPERLPDENIICAGAFSYSEESGEEALLRGKGFVFSLLELYGLSNDALNTSSLTKGEIIIEAGGSIVAVVQSLSENQRKEYKLKKPVIVFEISLTKLLTVPLQKTSFQPLPKYPAVTRDLTIVVETKVLWGDIEKKVLEYKTHLTSVSFLNRYGVSETEKSISFRMSFRDATRTLTADEVEEHLEKILALLEDTFDAKIRTA